MLNKYSLYKCFIYIRKLTERIPNFRSDGKPDAKTDTGRSRKGWAGTVKDLKGKGIWIGPD
jgi:hypothetical protein